MTKIVIVGILGKMGQMILSAAEQKSDLTVVAGVIQESSKLKNKVLFRGKEVTLTSNIAEVLQKDTVIIDFSHVEATLHNLPFIEQKKSKLVIGTTGFTKEQKKRIEQTAKVTSIVFSPNMSIGVNVLFAVVEQVSKTLTQDYDVEIIEAHHNQKKDSPSGTAKGLLESVIRGHRSNLKKACYGREGFYENRPSGEIGVHAVRGGDIVGDHTVLFAGAGERLELKHVAHDRYVFAQGACVAALFLTKQEQGLFTMLDVLGLS